MIERVLLPDRPHKRPFQPGHPDLRRDDEIIAQLDIALGFLGVRTEPEFLYLFQGQAAHPDDVKIEDGVLGDRVVPHFEDDGLVGTPRPLYLPAGQATQFVGRPGVA